MRLLTANLRHFAKKTKQMADFPSIKARKKGGNRLSALVYREFFLFVFPKLLVFAERIDICLIVDRLIL